MHTTPMEPTRKGNCDLTEPHTPFDLKRSELSQPPELCTKS